MQPFPVQRFQKAIQDHSQVSSTTGPKRIYYCQRCLNHGQLEPRKNHKADCQFASCNCVKCILVEKRRVLNLQLHDLEDPSTEPTPVLFPTSQLRGERVPNCQKCGQHGRKARLKGHKRLCPYKECECAKCRVVSERQKLMADQIKIRRRQRKDASLNRARAALTSRLPQDEHQQSLSTFMASRLPKDEHQRSLSTLMASRLPQDEQQQSLSTFMASRLPQDEHQRSLSTLMVNRLPQDEHQRSLSTLMTSSSPSPIAKPTPMSSSTMFFDPLTMGNFFDPLAMGNEYLLQSLLASYIYEQQLRTAFLMQSNSTQWRYDA